MSTAGGYMPLKELSPERAIYYWKMRRNIEISIGGW
jgi:hypothetical protein